jgi:hypothetical protein
MKILQNSSRNLKDENGSLKSTLSDVESRFETLLEKGKTRTMRMISKTIVSNIGNFSNSLSLRSDLAIAESKADYLMRIRSFHDVRYHPKICL